MALGGPFTDAPRDAAPLPPARNARRRVQVRKTALWWALAWTAIATGPPSRVAADDGVSLEYRVKAAYLLNFTKFIEWPPETFADASSPFSICIAGDDPFSGLLDRMVEGEAVNGRRLIVRRLAGRAPAACQIVFDAGPPGDRSGSLATLGPGVLTVGEGDTFLREGGIIAFVIENRRVRFDIRQSQAARAGLKISSKLLNVARSVEK